MQMEYNRNGVHISNLFVWPDLSTHLHSLMFRNQLCKCGTLKTCHGHHVKESANLLQMS